MVRASFLLALCLFSNSLWSQPLEINGLLIEGEGYTGKTTICQLLMEKLDKQNIEYHHFISGEGSLAKSILKQASQSVNISESAQLYAASFIVDLANFKPHGDAFYLQDRSWISMLNMNNLFLQDLQLADYVRENRLAFRWNVLLTVDSAIKKERFLQREKRSIFNQYIHDHPEINPCMMEEIPTNESWIIIDTSYLSPNEIVKIILEFVK